LDCNECEDACEVAGGDADGADDIFKWDSMKVIYLSILLEKLLQHLVSYDFGDCKCESGQSI
jgi:hypothetical protein